MLQIRIRPLGAILLMVAFLAAAVLAGVFWRYNSQSSTTSGEAAPSVGADAAPPPSQVTGFGSVAESDPTVKEAIEATDVERAKALIGKEATLKGKVHQIFVPESKSITILNFAEDYTTATSAVIEDEDRAAFSDLNALAGRRVVVKGEIIDFQGRPEIKIIDPSGIRIITP